MNLKLLLLAFLVVLTGCATTQVATGPDYRGFGQAIRNFVEILPVVAAERKLTLYQSISLLEQSVWEAARIYRVPMRSDVREGFAYIRMVADKIDRGHISRAEAEYLITKKANELQREREREEIVMRQREAERIKEYWRVVGDAWGSSFDIMRRGLQQQMQQMLIPYERQRTCTTKYVQVLRQWETTCD